MGKLHLSPSAAEDLENILRYTFNKWGIYQFEKYFAIFEQAFDSLKLDPGNSAVLRREELFDGCRSIRTGHHVVFFRIIGQDVEIVRILHERIDFAQHFEEEE